jgi:hypothetical protein
MEPRANQRAGPGKVLLGVGVSLAAFVFVALGATRADAAALTVADQKTHVTNTGTATATTGGNVAIGNASINTATNDQDAAAAGNGSVAANVATTSNTSNGSASITTGDATATGTQGTTSVTQAAASGGGSGLTIADQTARVTNDGDARARTGGNLAIGNASFNLATNDQEATASGGGSGKVAVNIADTSNTSDGSASITTGDASATGVVAGTSIDQSLLDGSNHGVVIADQVARVHNDGDAVARTGDNLAIGNASINVVDNDQDATATGGNGLAANFATVANRSNGSATVRTGNASAPGVDAWVGGSQLVAAGGGVLTLADQLATLASDGSAVAASGSNAALGNDSLNVAVNDQEALNPNVAVNLIDLINASNGSGGVFTGNATAWGTIVSAFFRQDLV